MKQRAGAKSVVCLCMRESFPCFFGIYYVTLLLMRPKCFVFVKTHTHTRIVLYCSLWKPVSKSYIMFSKQKSHNISIECANVQHINKVIFCLMCVVQCWSWRAGNTIRFFFLSRSAILFLLISVSVQAIMRCMWAYGFCFGFALPMCSVRCGFFFPLRSVHFPFLLFTNLHIWYFWSN